MSASPPDASLAGRATITQSLLGLAGLTELAYMAVAVARLGLLQRIRDGGVVSVAEANEADGRVAALALVSLLAGLASGISWLMWQHRAHTTVRHRLQVPRLSFTPGWAVGWWFVPLANLVQPFRAMRELWRAAAPGARTESWEMASVPAWFWAWCITFAGGRYLSVVVVRLAERDSIGDLIRAETLAIGAAALAVVAAVLAILVVRTVQARLDAALRDAPLGGGLPIDTSPSGMPIPPPPAPPPPVPPLDQPADPPHLTGGDEPFVGG